MHTPLHRFQDGSFEGFREARVERSGLLALALKSLEVVEPAFASNFALELLEAVKGHPGSILPAKWVNSSIVLTQNGRQVHTHRCRIFHRWYEGRRLSDWGQT